MIVSSFDHIVVMIVYITIENFKNDFNIFYKRCQQDSTNHICLLRGQLLKKYNLKYFHKGFKKILKIFVLKKYYYVKVYVKKFKKKIHFQRF